jgi:hypothetical protein
MFSRKRRLPSPFSLQDEEDQHAQASSGGARSTLCDIGVLALSSLVLVQNMMKLSATSFALVLLANLSATAIETPAA